MGWIPRKQKSIGRDDICPEAASEDHHQNYGSSYYQGGSCKFYSIYKGNACWLVYDKNNS